MKAIKATVYRQLIGGDYVPIKESYYSHINILKSTRLFNMYERDSISRFSYIHKKFRLKYVLEISKITIIDF